MTKEEKQRLSAVIRTTEYLFLENIALKLVLEHRAVPNWQILLDRLLADKEILAGVHLRFRDLYGQLAGSAGSLGCSGCAPRRTAGAEEAALSCTAAVRPGIAPGGHFADVPESPKS